MRSTKRIAAFLTAIAFSVLSVSIPAFAQTTPKSGSARLIAAPGNVGVPIKLDTSRTSLSGTAGQYAKLPAKVTNASGRTVKDVVAYVSLVDVKRGQQAPVDLEDWSAHRAVTIPTLAPGQSRGVGWNLRLVKGGDYLVYANAIANGSTSAAVGREVPLSVTARRNLNPGGVLPVAVGVPVVAGAVLLGPVALRQRRLG